MNFPFVFAKALICLVLLSGSVHAEPGVEQQVQTLEDEWAEIFYHQPTSRQGALFEALLPRVRAVKTRYPQRAEPLILEAIVLCTYAAADWGLSSLSRIGEARGLLVKSIDLDPKAMHASAFITLGNLYHRVPGWPISFGDDKLALQYLEAAHRMFPNALDSNYFLGDFWLHKGKFDRALPYLEKAAQAPIRAAQRLSDEKIKAELEPALAAARQRKKPHADFFDDLLPSILSD